METARDASLMPSSPCMFEISTATHLWEFYLELGSFDTIIKLAQNTAVSIHPINIGLRWVNSGPYAIDGDYNGHYFVLVIGYRKAYRLNAFLSRKTERCGIKKVVLYFRV